jgi:hypothetical protein
MFTDTANMWLAPEYADLLNLGTPQVVTHVGHYLDGMTIPQRLRAAQAGTIPFPFGIFVPLSGMVNARVMGGFEDGTLRPYDNLTRGQALAILFRVYGMYPSSRFADPYDG